MVQGFNVYSAGNTFMEHVGSLTVADPFVRSSSSAATQELPLILWTLLWTVLTKSPPLVPIPNQMNPVNTSMSKLSKIHFNIIHPLMSYLPIGLFPSNFPINNLDVFLFSPFCATCPAHLILLYFIILITLGKDQIIKLFIMQPFLSLHLSSVQIFSSAPRSHTQLLYFPPLMSEIKFHIHIEPKTKL
jgi:hypothetical protein